MSNPEISDISSEVSAKIDELPRDLKRILKVQWKELLHCIEDYEVSRTRNEPIPFGEPKRNAA
ncbi:MAG TPA: hypothetical protein V6C81_28080 [Planktothrix sp.]|jgi:hypothetical protein